MKQFHKVCSVLCAFLVLTASVFTSTFTTSAAEATKWTEENIAKGNTLYVGDTIKSIYSNTTIQVIYYDANNIVIKDDTEDKSLTVRSFSDSKSDIKYVAYKVTDWSMDNTTFKVSIKGIPRSTYAITAGTGPNGTITFSGIRDVVEGEDITYTITPNKGYSVDYVLVDGADQGAITLYKFYDVKASHSIVAYFKKGTSSITTTTTSAQSNQVSTVNYKAPLTSWASIAAKFDTVTAADLTTGGTAAVINVTGSNCYIDPTTIKHFDARAGWVMLVSYGTDASFTFYSDLDNSAFTGTNLGYSASIITSNGTNQKRIVFQEPGVIGTAICINVPLPNAVPGQTANVYIEDATGNRTLYVPVTVDVNKNITFAITGKVTLVITY